MNTCIDHFIRRAIVSILLCVAAALPALSQDTIPKCHIDIDPAYRLANVDYSCVRLPSDRKMLIAEAGNASAPTVVLVHGLGDNAHRDWKYAVPELAKQFHVVAVDLPGFGDSEPLPDGYSFAGLDAALEEVAIQRKLQQFHLVGHSLGAAVSLYYAERHPQRIRRLVLADAAGVLLQQVFTRQLIEANRASTGIDALGLLGVLAPDMSADRALDFIEDRVDVNFLLTANPALRRAIFGMQTYADAAFGLVEHDFTSAIRAVRAPTVIIWGENDNITPIRTGRLLAARMHEAQLRIVPDAQHVPMLQRPDAFNRELLSSLAGPFAPVSPSIAGPSQGDVTCNGQTNQRYSGMFDRLTLDNCSNAHLENARVRELRVQRSTLTMDRVTVESPAIALDASDSTITATGITLIGRTGIRAQLSRLDLAGATLRAQERAVQMGSDTRLYFSVSDVEAPDYRGDAHFIWPPK
ncbi:alpha/beta hydrolase [Povalibacter sp.]|uniref:alpha/beta fold hydrolase n=1 Tax=Povalibacter sp. TaxID=1962978 RepID=UPI002F3F6EAD